MNMTRRTIARFALVTLLFCPLSSIALAEGQPSGAVEAIVAAQEQASQASTPSAVTPDAVTPEAVTPEAAQTPQQDEATETEALVPQDDAVSVVAAKAPSRQAESADAQGAELAPQSDSGKNMYRLYNPNSGEHFYTANINEAKSVFYAGWVWEGVGWVAPTSGRDVYRLYNPVAGDHHYTLSTKERDSLVRAGWLYEGVSWKSGGTGVVLRQYNPNASTGTHNFTISANEDASLGGSGWRREGQAWNCLTQGVNKIQGFWTLSTCSGAVERYWIGSDCQLARNRYVTVSEGAGYKAFARPDGIIVRGTWDNGRAQVFLADNDGRLTTANGWLVTGAYDGGRLRRYYVDGATHTARTGHFTVGGAHYWGWGGLGYVACGKSRMGDGVLIADADGRLCLARGWVVTGDYDGGAVQRYYFDDCVGNGLTGARIGLFSVDGHEYWGHESEGYVHRNTAFAYGDEVLYFDNDGIMTREAQDELVRRANEYSSDTEYLIFVDNDDSHVYVFHGEQGHWQRWCDSVCSAGKDSTPTVRGVFEIGIKVYSFGHGYTCWFASQIYGDYLFHSVLYNPGSMSSIQDGRLGENYSHGCVRLPIEFAHWIYEYVPSGTTVVSY